MTIDPDILRRLLAIERRLREPQTERPGEAIAWTPLLTGSGGGGSYTTLFAVGEYIRDRGKVDVWCRYQVNTLVGVPAGTLRLTGLPFVARATANMFYTLAIGYTDTTLSAVMRALVPAGTAYVDFYTAAGASVNASVMAAGSYIDLGGSYPL